jgi:hypothetical protein
MRFSEKLLILFVAVVLSGLGFYLISSPFVGLHMSARKTDTETVKSYLAKYDDDASLMGSVIDRSLQITCFNFCSNHSRVFCSPGANK